MKTSFAVQALLYLSFDQVNAMRLSPQPKALAQTKTKTHNKAEILAKIRASSKLWNPDLEDDGAWMTPKYSMA